MSDISDMGYEGGRSYEIWVRNRRNWIVLHGQAKDNLKANLSSEILSQKVKKMQKFDKNSLFWDFDRFLTISGQRVIFEPPNLALFYFILSSSELIWSFTTGHPSVNSVRSAQQFTERRDSKLSNGIYTSF